MTFTAGTRLGVYEITGLIGVGGMGEVYRATDTKLGRTIAIKTLPSELANDTERLARFEREARLLAALNHAHIASIYGLNEHEGTQFLAMELVEGATLDRTLRDAAMPAEEALRLALQIAEALEAAHEKGVVHRDLKPANVMVTNDGEVKVLDFGLAKAVSDNPNEASPAHSPALSLAMTQRGLILGTAGYMSPEQASGQATDQRADIWAFGVVLFEMLTGAPLFSGESVPHILADVLRTEPDWNRLPKDVHPRLRLLLERCLAKKPRNRYHSIADVRLDIEAVLGDPKRADSTPNALATGARPPAATRIASGVAPIVVGGVIAVVGAWLLWPAPEARPVTRFSDVIGTLSGTAYPTISRDGSRIGYVAGTPPTIYVRYVDEFDARLISDSTGVAGAAPCFSPDATWIAYSAENQSTLRKVPVAGGRGLTLAEGLTGVATCDWAEDGNIYIQQLTGAILRVPESGGVAEPVTVVSTDAVIHAAPQLLPGGTALLFSVVTRLDARSVDVVVRDLETGDQITILERAGLAVFAPTGLDPSVGHLVYGQEGAIFAAAFDVPRLRVGAPSPVIEGALSLAGFTLPAVSSTGTLAYLTGESGRGLGATLSMFGRDGSEVLLPEQARFYAHVMVSPDGRRVAMAIFDPTTLTVDLWVQDLDGSGRLGRLTSEGVNTYPVWTPDGKRLIYANAATITGGEPTLRSIPADGSGSPLTLAAAEAFPMSISSDGMTLIGTRPTGNRFSDIWMLPLSEDLYTSPATAADLTLLVESRFNEQHATFSPDGRWIAFSSDESGPEEIYVVPRGGPGGKSQVSVGGGRQPRWNPNGRELFYINGDRMMVVEVETGTTFSAKTPEVLFEDPTLNYVSTNRYAFQYDVTPDGARFLMLKPSAPTAGAGAQLRVVQNWFEELKRRAPAE
jgi:Tol biopolymer transport system component